MIGTRQEASIWAHLDDHNRRLAGDSKGAAILQSHSLALNHSLSDTREEASMATGIVPQGSMPREQKRLLTSRDTKKRGKGLCY